MNPTTIILILLSCLMHAGWNLLARRGRREATCMRRMLVAIAAAGFFPALISEMHALSLTPTAWFCVLGSGVCCGFYYFGLARSYQSSDFTTAYPLVRALPVLLVGLGDLALGRYPSGPGWIGMALVVAGCLLAPQRSFRDLRLRHYLHRSLWWALLAALGTVGYTLLDMQAAAVVSRGPATAARYGYFFFLISAAVYMGLVQLRGTRDTGAEKTGWWLPTLAAVLNFGAYWLVLWAYQLAQHASYVVAFRQFSIVLGVIIAFAAFREKGLFVRLSGTFLITAGLVLIALYGG